MRNLLNKGKFLEEKYRVENYNDFNYEPVCANCCLYDEETGYCTEKKEFIDPEMNSENCNKYYD